MNLKTMREMKYEYTQLSNLSVDYISEKEVLEAIYTRMFEEKQQARKVKRDETGGAMANNLFLTNLTGHRKEAVQNDINEHLPKKNAEYITNTYPREEIINAVKAFYEEKTKTFNEVVEILESLGLGEPRKMNLSKLAKHYLESEIPEEDLLRVFPFDFFLTGDGLETE